MIIHLILACLLSHGLADQECGERLESNTGTAEIEPSSDSCLWIISLENMTGIKLELKQSLVEPLMVIPEQQPTNVHLKTAWINGSKKIYKFSVKSLAIFTPARNESTTLSWSGVVLDTAQVFLSTMVRKDSEGTLQWRHIDEGMDKIFWGMEFEETTQLNWTLDTVLPACEPADPCQSISFGVFQILPYGNISEIAKTCEGSTQGSLNLEKKSKILVLVYINSPLAARSDVEVTWKSIEPPKRNVAGVLAGTQNGTFVIVLNSSEPATRFSFKEILGLAFDWNSSKVYWAEEGAGIRRAYLDGSNSQLLLEDQDVRGLAIESISGNLYYCSRSKKVVRVCNNDAKNCFTIAVADAEDAFVHFAFHLSKGLLFMSFGNANKIVRANLDGTNATAIIETSDEARGIGLDEGENRLYWAHFNKDGIQSCDLNGQHVTVLPNIATDPKDIEVSGTKVYYTSWHDRSVRYTPKEGKEPTLVSKLPYLTWHIALFGSLSSGWRANPCEKSKCPNLCLLVSANTYRCV